MTTWTSLDERFDNLPLVLAGPIVRKVTRDSVTIWIALSGACDSVSLEIYNEENSSLNSAFEGGVAGTPTKLGAALHVIAITASGLYLNPGQLYYYNLFFKYNDFGAQHDLDLRSGGVLNAWEHVSTGTGAIELITYGTLLPSFLLPASHMNDLKILHGSCRKIHGGQLSQGDPQTPEYYTTMKSLDIDALSIVDDLLYIYSNNVAERPQQLFLTGDQIYADDVSDLMLYLINDAEPTIVGIEEELPDTDAASLMPLRRYNLINTAAAMSSDEYAKCHLMRLSEFYCMYLFSWSDVLWTTLPDVPTLSAYSPPIGDSETTHFALEEDDIDTYFEKEIEAINNFKSFLPKIRKALANIATYMMFDDHEITDDWFINKPWCEGVLAPANELGRRIIQNGLSAYAMFQACGNTPEIFSDFSSKESQIMASLNGLAYASSYDKTVWDYLGTLILPTTAPVTSSSDEVMKLTGGADWYYYLDFDYYQVIILNSRTQRGYNAKGHAKLLCSDALVSQFSQVSTDPKYKFTILVAPAPVIGQTNIESLQEFLIQASLKTENGGDYEPWAVDPSTLDGLLRRLTDFSKVIILSGDVHYAYSAQVIYSFDQNLPSPPSPASIIQLTSSALKNSDKLTQSAYLGFIGLETFSGSEKEIDLKIDLKPFTKSGWKTAGTKGTVETISSYSDMTGAMVTTTQSVPFVVEAYKDYCTDNYSSNTSTTFYTLTSNPDWQYTTSFIEDTRSVDARGTTTYGSGSSKVCIAARIHQTNYEFDRMSLAVGFCNIGQLILRDEGVSVDDEDIAIIKVVHRVWYKPAEGVDEGSWTEHELYL